MAEDTPTVFGEKATEQIAKTVREVARRMMLPRGHRGRWQFHGGAGGTLDTAWANITESGPDDMFQSVTLYDSASPATFTEATCGDLIYDDMQFTLCDAREGTETVLVPAGYKAGEAMLIKFLDCGGAHAWNGWVVVAGPRMRCSVQIPTEISCCPIEGLKFTAFDSIWYFGGALDPVTDPCAEA